MAEFNFADNYRAAGLSPGPDIIRLRHDPFEKLRKGIEATTSVDLTRLYFGFPIARGAEWFREVFGETDPSFSLYENGREVAVLAGGLLSAAIADGKMHAALAPLAAAAAGLRKPAVWPELLVQAQHALSAKAIADRQRERSNTDLIKLPPKSKVPAEADALAQGADWNKAASMFKKISNEAYEAAKNLASQTAEVVRPLAYDVADLREEVAMLWWHIGGWSRIMERPFAELEPAVAAVMAGLDLADLCNSHTGPAAAPAILQRTIMVGRQTPTPAVTLNDAVDALPSDVLARMSPSEIMASVPDICPILTAFGKARDIGSGTTWHGAYQKASGLEPSAKFKLLDLALQVYRERQLLAALSG